jgi:exodeoxyribonuclease VII large subunit
MELLNNQLAGSLQLQNEKVSILNDQLLTYKTQISSLEQKSTNWTAVIIAIIVGMIIGFLLKGR